jgi:hypothetical protein
MTRTSLTGIDGSNPLGFLAALGTLVAARAAGEGRSRLGWSRSRTWTPVLDGLSTGDAATLGEILAGALRGEEVAPEAERKREKAEDALKSACTAVTKMLKEIKKQGLRGAERKEALEAHVRPLERERDLKRKELHTLRGTVPRPELALGDRIDCTGEEYREHASAFLAGADRGTRETLDLLAAFASDGALERTGKVEPTPFYFIRGESHQEFLRTARKLIAEVSPERVQRAIFEPWTYRDRGLSMRWDPFEDKRYALTHENPADQGAWTVWMANLLAYRALVLFPCAPERRGLGATGWTLVKKEWVFTWPIWESAAPPDTIRSLLQLRDLTEPQPDRSTLRARGVAAVFRARRIRVGAGSNYKLNFSPARAL